MIEHGTRELAHERQARCLVPCALLTLAQDILSGHVPLQVVHGGALLANDVCGVLVDVKLFGDRYRIGVCTVGTQN